MNKLLALSSLVVAVTVGCAGANVRPLVDMKGVNEASYEKDLSECQAYAQQQSGMGETAAKGAGAGAVVGGLLGLVTGGNKTGIAQAAGDLVEQDKNAYVAQLFDGTRFAEAGEAAALR